MINPAVRTAPLASSPLNLELLSVRYVDVVSNIMLRITRVSNVRSAPSPSSVPYVTIVLSTNMRVLVNVSALHVDQDLNLLPIKVCVWNVILVPTLMVMVCVNHALWVKLHRLMVL